jgi:hypothetical protein
MPGNQFAAEGWCQETPVVVCVALKAELVAPKEEHTKKRLSAAGSVLGHGLGALRHGVLGELSREEQTDGGLDFAGRQGGLLVVADQLARLAGDALEQVVDERVHDRHATAGDAGVGVNLLQHLVDVGGIRLSATLLPLAALCGRLLGLAFAGRFCCCYFGRHNSNVFCATVGLQTWYIYQICCGLLFTVTYMDNFACAMQTISNPVF